MNNFEKYSKGTIEAEEGDDLLEEKRRLKEMEDFATNVASRAAILRDGVLGLLRTLAANDRAPGSDDASSSSVPLLKEQIATLESTLRSTESKFEAMASSRNEAASSERRVRRGLYRLANGRMTLEEVLKAVEKEDNGVSFDETLAMIDGRMNNSKNAMSTPDGTAPGVISPSDGMTMSSPAAKDSPSSTGEDVAQLKKSLQDVQVIAEERDKKIMEVSVPEEFMCSVNLHALCILCAPACLTTCP